MNFWSPVPTYPVVLHLEDKQETPEVLPGKEPWTNGRVVSLWFVPILSSANPILP